MKLRNKTTGETVHVWEVIIEGRAYNSLSEIKEDYEDINAPEPLIKDENIRKAVRAWAEACDIESCYLDCGEFCTKHREINCCIGFGESVSEIPLKEKHYTIAELCGEEEE